VTHQKSFDNITNSQCIPKTSGSLGPFLCRSDVTSISLKSYFSNNYLLTVEQHQSTLVVTPRCSSSLSCMSEYLAVDSGGYMCV